MKIIHLAYSDYIGGAAIAANRIHISLKKKGIESEIWVNESFKKRHSSKKLMVKIKKILTRLRRYISWPIIILNKTKIPINHSISILPSGWVKKINDSDANIVNLHWIQREMISIEDIGKITKPLVWTLHDMWAFCGAEHYTEDTRWFKGYFSKNRPRYELGLDINRWTWLRKKKNWKKKILIIAPSNWLSICAKKSYLMKSYPTSVIPNPIDTEIFKPVPKRIARDKLNLPQNTILILFGAIGGTKDSRKGFDLLVKSLEIIKIYKKKFELVIFGEKKFNLGFEAPVHFLGEIRNESMFKNIYSACNMTIIPSRQDNLPNIALESQSCDTPVVSFNIGGLKDIIDHQSTGYLAKAFNVKDLAKGINWTIENRDNIKGNCRKNILKNFSEESVSEKYIKLYKKLLIN